MRRQKVFHNIFHTGIHNYVFYITIKHILNQHKAKMKIFILKFQAETRNDSKSNSLPATWLSAWNWEDNNKVTLWLLLAITALCRLLLTIAALIIWSIWTIGLSTSLTCKLVARVFKFWIFIHGEGMGVTGSRLQSHRCWCQLKVLDTWNMHTKYDHCALYEIKVCGDTQT